MYISLTLFKKFKTFVINSAFVALLDADGKYRTKIVKLARSVNVYLLVSLRHISAIDCGFQKS